MERACATCGATGVELLGCSRCTKVFYCSQACQRAGWRAGHKAACPLLCKSGLDVADDPHAVPSLGDMIASNEGITVTVVSGHDALGSNFCYMYTRADHGPFAETAIVALDVHISRMQEMFVEFNEILTLTPPGGGRMSLLPNLLLAWSTFARPDLRQVAILIDPSPDARATLLRDFVCKTSAAFDRAGAAARVLVLVPALREEMRMLLPPSGPERTAIAVRVSSDLNAVLAAPTTPGVDMGRVARGRRTFELLAASYWAPAQSDMLFMRGNEGVLDGAPQPHMIAGAAELVAAMTSAERETLMSAYARAFPGPGGSAGPPLHPSSTVGILDGWRAFTVACVRVGLTDLQEMRLVPASEGGNLVLRYRVEEIALALYAASASSGRS